MENRLIRAVIADDEPLLRAELSDMLARWWPELQIAEQVGDGRAAVASVMRVAPEVVFLDVNMPRLNGMAAAQQMRQGGYVGAIVFVTAYDQYAVRAFEQRAIDYLVKPLDEARLRDTITRLRTPAAPLQDDSPGDLIKVLRQTVVESVAQAMSQTRPSTPEAMPWLRVASGKQIQLVPIEEVACFRAVPGYTQVTTRQGEHLISETLAHLRERLDPHTFVQVHRASIVNLRFVARIHRERPGRFLVELKHGLGKVETSRARAEFFRDL